MSFRKKREKKLMCKTKKKMNRKFNIKKDGGNGK